MSLAAGTKLGPYEILSPLGAGGMGEVYRARDTRLERTVALKILPEQFSTDAVRKQRFEREAKTISGLNHPNICVLHDVGSQSGVDFLVMEYIEGETLAKRLERGPLPFEQVVRVGREIAEALDKAHRAGIVHRDLKPGNIMLTSSGVKLLDFGLAKPATVLSGATVSAVPMKSSPVTEEGMIVGTFRYMSPEQVEGKEVDGRSDIFSLGTVMYEMVTGKKAFEGRSQYSVASAILEKEPESIATIKPLTPPGLDHAIRRSLAKNPDERWQMARDLALELNWVAEVGSQAGVPALLARTGRKREWLAWALAVLLGGVVAVLVFYPRQVNTTLPVVVSELTAPTGTHFDSLVNGRPAISPDGHAIVFSARGTSAKSSLWVRSLDGTSPQMIPGSEEAGAPFWSPDGKQIGFSVARGRLAIVPVGGGSPQTLREGSAGGGDWSQNGTIMFVGEKGIYQMPASGGNATLLVPRDSSKYAFMFNPVFLPGGRYFLFTGATNPADASVYIARLDGKENRLLIQGSHRAIYASGFLLYARGSSLMAQPFEPRTGYLSGTARPIVEQVQQGAFTSIFDASQNGILIYQPSTRTPTTTQLGWYDRTGKKLSSIGVPGVHFDLRLSPDGHKLASSVGQPKSEIWVDDLDRGVRMRLTFDPETDNGIPVWSPDGKVLLFSTLLGSKAGVGIFRKAADGAGGLEMLLPTDKPEREAWATDWSRDARFMLFSRGGLANSTNADIWVLPMTGERKPAQFLHSATSAFDAEFSPDVRWVAYTSTESGRDEVYVVPFDAARIPSGSGAESAPAGKWQISSEGARFPRWRKDGKELYYLGLDNAITAVEVDGSGASFTVGRSQRLFVAPVNPFASTYDVSPDGQRFVMSASPDEEEPPLVLMINWTAQLKQK